jgi:hypothetical protein
MRLWLLLGAFVAAALIVCVLSPGLRAKVQSRFERVGREVLATAEGDVLNDGSPTRLIEYRNREGLFVEVVRQGENGETTLIERIPLPDKHDGMFNFQGRVTRLAVMDVNHDGQNMLLAPTFDAQLIPHLNVFRYNSTLHHFESYSPSK